MRPYPLFRKIHGYSGLMLLLFVVMYFVTGLPIVHPGLLPASEPRVTTDRVGLSLEGEPTADELSRHVQEVTAFRGRAVSTVRDDDGRWQLAYERPGTSLRVEVGPDLATASVREEDRGLRGRVVELHRLHGFHGGIAFGLWGLLYDLVSVSMIVFALSGIYLWYRRTRDRRLGWVMLAVSWGFALFTTVYLAVAP
jgi:hypothetical protein